LLLAGFIAADLARVHAGRLGEVGLGQPQLCASAADDLGHVHGLPVDTSAIAFLCALEPQPVLDFETRQPRADGNGEPLYVVQLIALGEGEAEILAVKVPGLPSGIRQGHPVKVTGLVAQPWSMNDRAGVAFRAARIEPVVAQAKAS
jgi:hypothetical protein